MLRPGFQQFQRVLLVCGAAVASGSFSSTSFAENGDLLSTKRQPSFGISSNLRKLAPKRNEQGKVTLDSMMLLTGSAHKSLALEISSIIGS